MPAQSVYNALTMAVVPKWLKSVCEVIRQVMVVVLTVTSDIARARENRRVRLVRIISENSSVGDVIRNVS